MARWQVAAQNAPLILRGIYEYNIASRFGPLRPREWLFPVTYRCDARCIMCHIWQTDKSAELSFEDWANVLQDPLFSSVESVSLTGGEPTLHRDLPRLAELLTVRLASLQRLTLTTNALNSQRVEEHCLALLDLCLARHIRFFVGISLDGIGKVHDEMRNLAGAFDEVARTAERLLRLQPRGLRLGINCTLTSRNLDEAGRVHRWGAAQGLRVNFIVASFADSYYANTESAAELAFTTEQRTKLAAFLGQLASQKSPGYLAAYFYADAAAMVGRGKSRATPCVFQKDAFMLDARGDLQYCMYSRTLGNVLDHTASDIYYGEDNLAHRQEIIASKCRHCTITCFLELALAKDAFRYARFLAGGLP